MLHATLRSWGTRQHPAKKRDTARRYAVETLEMRRVLATLVVTSLDDNVASDQVVTLREAILAANNDLVTDVGDIGSGADTIVFDPELFSQGAGSIVLELGQLDITNDLTIIGPSPEQLEISGNHASRVFRIGQSADSMLSGVTIRNGFAETGGGIANFGTLSIRDCEIKSNAATQGGGISNEGTLAISTSVVANNSATDAGGGLYNGQEGSSAVNSSTFSGNLANGDGGGAIFNHGSLVVSQSTLGGNHTTGGGGGIENFSGTATVTSSTVHDNQAERYGGGILNNGLGEVTVVNTTISGNSAGINGGGISNFAGKLTVINCTVVLNRADADGDGIGEVGGITTTFRTAFDTATLHNTIVAGNVRGTSESEQSSDVTGARDIDPASSHNLIGDAASSGGLRNGIRGNLVGAVLTDILELELRDNGGPTQTHALIASGLAIDAGDNARAIDSEGSSLTSDQRGLTRIVDGDFSGAALVDIGAYELGAEPVERLNQIAGRIDGLISAGVLNKGQGNALQVKLQESITKFENGNTSATVSLKSFLNQVRAFVKRGTLSAEEGSTLIDVASQVIGLESDSFQLVDHVFASRSNWG